MAPTSIMPENLEATADWRETIPGVLALGPEWDRTLEAWGIDNPFLRWDWIRTWLRVYGGKTRLLVGAFRAGGRIIGLAPLQVVHEKVGPVGPILRSVRLLGDGVLCPDHMVLPVEPGWEDPYARLLLRELEARRSSWDRVELRDLLAEGAAWKSVERAARAAGQEPRVQARTHCPYLPLPPTWEAYLAALSAHARSRINYQERKVTRDLGLAPREPRSVPEVDALMGRLEELHGQAWERRGQPGVFADPQFRLFHRLHARRAFRSGRLLLLALQGGPAGRAAGVLLAFLSRRAAHYYQSGYDPGLQKHSPGSVTLLLVVRTAIERGLQELDFLRGTGVYKSRLTEQERRGWDLSIHAGSPADHAAQVVTGARRRIGGAMRSMLGPSRIKVVKRILGLR